MKNETTEAPDDQVRNITFPWPGTLGALAAISYLLLTLKPSLAAFYALPDLWFQPDLGFPVAGAFMVLVLFDLRRYYRESVRQRADLKGLKQEVQELWESKKRLQLKAHTYSDHADKLKRFISDKLLEYIEYDEKFLHFKSIAAEVRHNGVISFDKVQTTLQRIEDEADTPEQVSDVRAARDAMRYLWDLLDLSTADNLALHIGNLLCECEEHYYQQVLNTDEEETPLPYDPVYSPQRAAWRALDQVCHKGLAEPLAEADFVLDDGQWHIQMAPVNALLGNENHLVLMLENLLKNAQFYSRKRGYNSPFAPVAMTLTEHQGNARLRIYNRGPHIRDEERQNLFQLGFSTRRARDHHGRGLGLYFVNEIVKGYEGHIAVHNIETPEAQYAVRIELENGEVMTELVDVAVEDGKPRCRVGDNEASGTWNWTFPSPLRSVEVTTTGNQTTQRLEDFASKGKHSRFDPGTPERSQWRISYQPRRNAHQLVFEPLDISGVEFDIRLPTAQQRLDNSELALDEDIDAEVERLDEHFRSPEAGH